jgi:hypothetical protein
MNLELKTDGVDFVVSKLPEPKNDENGAQKADRTTGELLFVTEMVVMDDSGAEVIKVTTGGAQGDQAADGHGDWTAGHALGDGGPVGTVVPGRLDRPGPGPGVGAGCGMTAAVTAVRVDVEAAARAYEAAELAFNDAAEAERAQYERWQESFGASEVAKGEADRAWRRYRAAVAG